MKNIKTSHWKKPRHPSSGYFFEAHFFHSKLKLLQRVVSWHQNTDVVSTIDISPIFCGVASPPRNYRGSGLVDSQHGHGRVRHCLKTGVNTERAKVKGGELLTFWKLWGTIGKAAWPQWGVSEKNMEASLFPSHAVKYWMRPKGKMREKSITTDKCI